MPKKNTNLSEVLDVEDIQENTEKESVKKEAENKCGKGKRPKKIRLLDNKVINHYPIAGNRGVGSKRLNNGMITEDIFIIEFAVKGGINYEEIAE